MLHDMHHELARRTYGGIDVRLLWDALRDRILVRYRDARTGDAFTTEVPKAEALRAFEHPNAYRPVTAVAA